LKIIGKKIIREYLWFYKISAEIQKLSIFFFFFYRSQEGPGKIAAWRVPFAG
jgi:hypothetical protein